MRALWRQFQEWRTNRMVTKFIVKAAVFMLEEASRRLHGPLSREEVHEMLTSFNDWLCADIARIDALVDRPTRTVHLFLSERL